MSAAPGLVPLEDYLFLLSVLLFLILTQYILDVQFLTWIALYVCIVISALLLVVLAVARQHPNLFWITHFRCLRRPIPEESPSRSSSPVLERHGVITLYPENIQLMWKEYCDNLVQGIEGASMSN